MTVNIFEIASRKKYRFASPQGGLLVEQLWDLPLQGRKNEANLDDIAIALNKQLKETGEESFVSTKKNEDTDARYKLDILRHIIAEKIAATEKAGKAAEKRQRKQRVLELIREKDDAALAGKSKEDLEKLIAEIDAED
jgi:hypothetical protein